MIAIDIERKLKTYTGNHVLKVNRQFETGTLIKVYGPSGSGKTTLLKCIAGLVNPEKGLITFKGQTWLNTEAAVSLPPQKRKCGFVFQDYALFPNMTVRQHLEYATNDNDWINKLLAIGKMESFVRQKPENLSGGQQQRLAVLRALAIKPEVLLMDEPFSALDVEMKIAFIGQLKHLLNELNTTTFIVTHNPSEIENWYNQEIFIDSGIER